MKSAKLFLLLCIASLFLITNCKRDDIKINPKKAILGKWEIIEIGNWSNMESCKPNGYVEFLPDSIIGYYDYQLNEYTISNEKYWIDSLLHKGITDENGFFITFEYKYTFQENTLRLDVTNWWMQYNSTKYKRLE